VEWPWASLPQYENGQVPAAAAQFKNLILSALHDIITEAIAVRRFVARLVSVAKTNVRKYTARAHNVMFWSGENEASQNS
jgi:hypothetical protein